MQRILVTGASGFVGVELVKKLKKVSNLKIITVDLRGSDFNGDLSCKDFVDTLPDVEIIIHLAGVQYLTANRPRLFLKNYFHHNNVQSVSNLCARYSHLNKFIFIGTSMMYASEENSILETDENFKMGNGLYANSKIIAYEIIRSNYPQAAVCAIIPTIICGEGRGGFFSLLKVLINDFRIYPKVRSNSSMTGVVHVSDFVELIKFALNPGASGVFNAQSAASSFDDWVKSIACVSYVTIRVPSFLIRAINKLFLRIFLAKEQETMLVRSHHLAIDRSLELGWRPKFTLQQCIASSLRPKNGD